MSESKWGYIDKTGKFVIEPKYDYADIFIDGRSEVSIGDQRFLIDKQGKKSEPNNDLLEQYYYHEGFVPIRRYDGGYKDRNGNVIKIKIDDNEDDLDAGSLKPFSNGLAAVRINRKWGYVDKKGNVVIPPQFDRAGFFACGIADVEYCGKTCYIDKKGNILPYDKVVNRKIINGTSIISIHGKQGLIDEDGNYIVTPIYDSVGFFVDDLAYAKTDDKYGYIDKNGRFIISPQFEEAGDFQNNFAPVRMKDKWGIINKTGDFVVSPSFEAINLKEHFAFIKVGDKWGSIDNTGNIIITPIFEELMSYGSVLFAKVGDKWGTIDNTGNFIVKPIIESFDWYSLSSYSIFSKNGKADNIISIKVNDKYGFVDNNGNLIIEPMYEDAKSFTEGLAPVEIKNDSIKTTKTPANESVSQIISKPNNQEAFTDWCKYWSDEFSRNIHDWRAIVDKGIQQENYSNLYICHIEFDSSDRGAHNDVAVYGQDYGYGVPIAFIEQEGNGWNVALTCPDLPLVIRMANNHGGHITWWNETFLKEPKMKIPFYLPSKPKDEKKGCYIATAVYGSYNCPEVWTLRRFRDNTLDATWYGRTFIKTYYAISPTLVKWFGETSWFKRLWHRPLDKLVNSLCKRGVKSTPYDDKY